MPHTPGPWISLGDHVDDCYGRVLCRSARNWAGTNPKDFNLIAAAPEMCALLKELEWFEHHESQTDLRCPVCRGYADLGHEPDCRLAAVLKAVEGEAK